MGVLRCAIHQSGSPGPSRLPTARHCPWSALVLPSPRLGFFPPAAPLAVLHVSSLFAGSISIRTYHTASSWAKEYSATSGSSAPTAHDPVPYPVKFHRIKRIRKAGTAPPSTDSEITRKGKGTAKKAPPRPSRTHRRRLAALKRMQAISPVAIPKALNGSELGSREKVASVKKSAATRSAPTRTRRPDQGISKKARLDSKPSHPIRRSKPAPIVSSPKKRDLPLAAIAPTDVEAIQLTTETGKEVYAETVSVSKSVYTYNRQTVEEEEIQKVLNSRISTIKDKPPHMQHINQNAAYESLSSKRIEALLSKHSQPVEDGLISAADIALEEINPLRKMEVATLRSQLSRVLFSPGVHFLQDPRTGVYNFDPAMQKIPQPDQYAFDRAVPYQPPSKDRELESLVEANSCRFAGSTSTLTKLLSHIYLAISGGKAVDTSMFSQAFAEDPTNFTYGATLPAANILRRTDEGVYLIDQDKDYDLDNNILSSFGVILERMLVSEEDDFKRFLKSSPPESVSEEERNRKEAYMYQKVGSILMRSQLDCRDPRLPGTGIFDIKTRACVPLRFDRANHIANSQYDMFKERGYDFSYEREDYDLLRSAMLKYSMQVRIGKMDGIFVAYHNTTRIFGFRYIPLAEMDRALFGSTELAEQAFKLSVSLLEKVLEASVECFEGEDIRVILRSYLNDTNPTATGKSVVAYVTPAGSATNQEPRPTQAISVNVKSFLDGAEINGPMQFSIDETTRQAQNWSIQYSISKTGLEEHEQAAARYCKASAVKALTEMLSLSIPEGTTVQEMRDAEKPAPSGMQTRWVMPSAKALRLREAARCSGQAYDARRGEWKPIEETRSWVKV